METGSQVTPRETVMSDLEEEVLMRVPEEEKGPLRAVLIPDMEDELEEEEEEEEDSASLQMLVAPPNITDAASLEGDVTSTSPETMAVPQSVIPPKPLESDVTGPSQEAAPTPQRDTTPEALEGDVTTVPQHYKAPQDQAVSRVSDADDRDSEDESVNVILPSLEEQREYARAAAAYTQLFQFQKIFEKTGCAAFMRKRFVLTQRDVWDSVAVDNWRRKERKKGTLPPGEAAPLPSPRPFQPRHNPPLFTFYHRRGNPPNREGFPSRGTTTTIRGNATQDTFPNREGFPSLPTQEASSVVQPSPAGRDPTPRAESPPASHSLKRKRSPRAPHAPLTPEQTSALTPAGPPTPTGGQSPEASGGGLVLIGKEASPRASTVTRHQPQPGRQSSPEHPSQARH